MEIFNLDEALYRMDNDLDLLKSVIKVFINDLPEQIKLLKEFVDINDIASIEMQSHSIKGGASNIGAEVLKEHFRKIETYAREGNLAKVKKLFNKHTIVVDELKQKLKDYLI